MQQIVPASRSQLLKCSYKTKILRNSCLCSEFYDYLCSQNLTIQNKKIRKIGNLLSDVRCYIAKLWCKIENR